MAQKKPFDEMTMDEMDAIIGPTTETVVLESPSTGVSVIYNDENNTYLKWPDDRVGQLAKPDLAP